MSGQEAPVGCTVPPLLSHGRAVFAIGNTPASFSFQQTDEKTMISYKIGYLIGSLAKGSINRKLAQSLIKLAPPNLSFTEISFKELPLYSYDYDAIFPP